MKLSDYVDRKHISTTSLADALGVTPMSARRYVRGTRIPTQCVMRKLSEITDGKVTANDFYGISDHTVPRGSGTKRRRTA